MWWNIPSSLVNMIIAAFFVVVAIGVALAAYAAIQMKKMEEKIQK
ncbi:MAG TPA: hypothetical protein VFH17_05815 [Coriobacteriia bacterium]|nr:hypothetical protein [Coriobacteriia bacterium]